MHDVAQFAAIFELGGGYLIAYGEKALEAGKIVGVDGAETVAETLCA